MSYFNLNGNIDIKNNNIIMKYLLEYKGIKPEWLKSELKSINKNNISDTKKEAIFNLFVCFIKIMVGQFIVRFTDAKLSKLTINKITKNLRNKKFVEFLEKEIKNVYINHPEYRTCNGDEFTKTDMFNYFLANFRDRNNIEILKDGFVTFMDIILSIISTRLITLPGSIIATIPLKMMLGYCGVRIGLSVYNILFDYKGRTMSMGLEFSSEGFIISNVILYSFKTEEDGTESLIQSNLKTPPQSTYELTKDDVKEILNKYGDDSDLTLIKKAVDGNDK